ncbi:MAG: hypothetical protein ABSB41_03925 [Anaerolineales bacterium]|jgi:hypothetical protein
MSDHPNPRRIFYSTAAADADLAAIRAAFGLSNSETIRVALHMLLEKLQGAEPLKIPARSAEMHHEQDEKETIALV